MCGDRFFAEGIRDFPRQPADKARLEKACEEGSGDTAYGKVAGRRVAVISGEAVSPTLAHISSLHIDGCPVCSITGTADTIVIRREGGSPRVFSKSPCTPKPEAISNLFRLD